MPAARVRKIAVLLPSLQVGGAERVVIEELACMKGDERFAFEVHLLFDRGEFFPSLAELGIPVHVWDAPHKSPRMALSYLGLVRHLRRSGCNLLHCHLLNSFGPIVGRLAGVKVAATVHSDARFSPLERFALGRCDLVLGCGTQVMGNIRGFVPAGRTRQLQNSIRLPQGEPADQSALRERFDIGPEAKVVLSLGRLVREKGYDILIEAFRLVAGRRQDAILLIGGDGPERQNLRERIVAAGLEDRVRLLGTVRDVAPLYGLCDLYVNSSRVEGLPMTLLEAMAHRRAIVATEVGGNPEVVRDGVSGLLIPPGDPEKLAAAMVALLADGSLRKGFGDGGHGIVAGEYTIENHCRTLADYYLQLLG